MNPAELSVEELHDARRSAVAGFLERYAELFAIQPADEVDVLGPVVTSGWVLCLVHHDLGEDEEITMAFRPTGMGRLRAIALLDECSALMG